MTRTLLALAIFVLLFLPRGAAASPASVLWVEAKCALCHAKDGSGSTDTGRKLNVRDLRSAEVQKRTDPQLAKTITTGHKRMPAFQRRLTYADVRLLIGHIRALAKPAKK